MLFGKGWIGDGVTFVFEGALMWVRKSIGLTELCDIGVGGGWMAE